MDVSSTSNLVANAGDQAGIAVLKKAMDFQKQATQTLVDSVANTANSANLPPHLGQNINTTA